ncbi:dentin sialophosphoprotein [Sitodiplosis mosellana]|uniref:dentin sialophosphoprotein n=1 Tax=Sitodiplosis mosellana TaxID=263140 RepID=UPI002443C264|nr:dentin sialophosphoprotein [Sitodiplosis mosellana]
MKVDKAVCTTDTMTDAESAISYENLLSTLVQKKILAIKRECEAKKVAKQRRKQQNCLGSLIFGNRYRDRTNKCDDDNGNGDGGDDDDNDNAAGRANEATVATATDDADPSISAQVTVTDSKESMRKSDDDNRSNQIAVSILLDNQERGESMVAINRSGKGIIVEKDTLPEVESTKCHIDVVNERCERCTGGKGDNDNNTTHDHNEFYTSNVNVKNRSRYTIENSQNISGTPMMEANGAKSKNDDSIIELNVESTGTATNSKSPSIVSQIEVSDEINPKQQHHHHHQQQELRARKNGSDTISVPSSMKHTALSAPAANAMALHDQEQRHQKRLLEAKSISAQCSPILTQRQTFNVSTAGKANKSPLPQRLFSMQNTSDDSVNATLSNSPSNIRDPTTTTTTMRTMTTTTTTKMNDPSRDDTDERSSNSQAAIAAATVAKSTKRSSKTFFKKKDKSVPKRSNANNESHGFISSFNQLTSNNLPVITSATTTMLKQKHVTSNKCERDNHGPIDEGDDISAEHNSNKKAAQDDRSKYRRTHRRSEPMLVYPSPSHLQHCILSMPPNQPIQLRYNDELMYDVSLKMETDSNNDFTNDRRRRHRNHKHRHHHHHHHHHHGNGRKKRHKRKILLHDLDEQVVKVIDPEDMSQRARWTIIATACLLLLMCLLLVGVTLRMAPLIDDIVRQENERIQESMNRGKYVRNITHAAFIGGQQYQQQSQHP